MKKIYFLLFISLIGCKTNQSPLDTWMAGTANDDVFLEMTPGDLQALHDNQLNYLEVDWPLETLEAPEEAANWGNALKTKTQTAGITIWSAHLPFGGSYDISQTDETLRRKAVELNLADIEVIAQTLSPSCLIIHPSAEPINDEERTARIESSRKSLQEIAARTNALNIILMVENLPRTCLGNTSTELLQIIEDIPCQICFDVNHLLKEEHTAFIQNTKGKIGTTHMSDYDRKNERHWMPGEGIINWNRLLHDLVESGYKGPFIFEISKGTPAKTIPDLKNVWEKLKKEYNQ